MSQLTIHGTVQQNKEIYLACKIKQMFLVNLNFLIFICTIKFCITHHFVSDKIKTLHTAACKTVNRFVNNDMMICWLWPSDIWHYIHQQLHACHSLSQIFVTCCIFLCFSKEIWNVVFQRKWWMIEHCCNMHIKYTFMVTWEFSSSHCFQWLYCLHLWWSRSPWRITTVINKTLSYILQTNKSWEIWSKGPDSFVQFWTFNDTSETQQAEV